MADSLSIFGIKRRVGNEWISDFDDVVDAERLASVDNTFDFDSPATAPTAFTARLYVWEGSPQPPAWLGFLQEGFGTHVFVPDTTQSRALLVVKAFFRVDRLYCVPFGGGRFQIRKDVIDRRYGLRVALNSLYEGDNRTDELTIAPRIRQVESKTVAANTMRTVRQSNRTTDFEDFELDPEYDQLASVTGQPADPTWARRIRGADSIRIARRTRFEELGALCRRIASLHEGKDYKRRFDFVDRFEGISDPSRIAELEDRVRESLRTHPDGWALVVPGIQDFDAVASYRVTFPNADPLEMPDPTIPDLVDHVGSESLADDAVGILVESLDEAGDRIAQHPLFGCLDGQLIHDEWTTQLESGVFYAIEADYLAEIDAAITAIPLSDVDLPDSVRTRENGELIEIEEGEYNDLAAKPVDRFLLDKKTVRVSSKTSPIEVCDVLTLDRHLIHVKRKFSSSSLSHLFGQGYVSSELLVDSQEYRERIRDKIGPLEPEFQALFPDSGVVPQDWKVVYAIVGDWGGAPPAKKLPFFSKINLLNHARGLRRLGFAVELAKVPVVDP